MSSGLSHVGSQVFRSDVAVLVELGLPVDEVSQRFAFALSLDHSLSCVLLLSITLIFALLIALLL